MTLAPARPVRDAAAPSAAGAPYPVDAPATVRQAQAAEARTDAPDATDATNAAPVELPHELRDLMRRLEVRRPSQRHPALYPLAVRWHRVRRRLRWLRSDVTGSVRWAKRRADGHDLPEVRVKRHNSLLRRTLGADEMWMQENKVVNLRLAAAELDGVVIRPGEVFSFNRTVGNCTRLRGYKIGMRLSNGEATPGVGGGICQAANLVHWLALHSPLTVVERSQHSFDPFPDNGRVLPWGVGCSIVYNYVDLQLRNDTDLTFVLRVGVGDRYLEGELLADRRPAHSYRVRAEGELFARSADRFFRHNRIVRDVIDRRTGNQVDTEHVRTNTAWVRYLPEQTDVHVLDADHL